MDSFSVEMSAASVGAINVTANVNLFYGNNKVRSETVSWKTYPSSRCGKALARNPFGNCGATFKAICVWREKHP